MDFTRFSSKNMSKLSKSVGTKGRPSHFLKTYYTSFNRQEPAKIYI